MKRPLRLACFACVLLLVGGCGKINLKGSTPAPVTQPSSLASAGSDMLAYAQRFGELPAEEQKKEYGQVTQALARDKADLASRMKAALIYSLPASRHRDSERALTLLDEVLRDGRINAGDRALASLLKGYTAERQKLESAAAKSGQKASEEQKRADAEQKRADDLQQKLDELKNIDKAISERYQTRPR